MGNEFLISPTGSFNFDVPPPVIFNSWKHHKLFIQSRIGKYSDPGLEGLPGILKEILAIGDSQIDLYTGNLGVLDISGEITGQLKVLNVYEKPEYCNWIGTGKDAYKLIALSDGSTWTLRTGIQAERYIHIHPARYTKDSIRLRSHTLKTAILTILLAKINGIPPFQISLINSVRHDYLSLAPVKSLERSFGLLNVISVLNS